MLLPRIKLEAKNTSPGNHPRPKGQAQANEEPLRRDRENRQGDAPWLEEGTPAPPPHKDHHEGDEESELRKQN
jgi:hypothetical protein